MASCVSQVGAVQALGGAEGTADATMDELLQVSHACCDAAML